MKKRSVLKGSAVMVSLFAAALGFAACGGESASQRVVDAINALPAGTELSIGDRSTVEDARTLYDALNADERSKIGNYEKLTAAETVMETLKGIAALNPVFDSSVTATVGVTYTPQISGYEFSDITTVVSYSVKDDTAGATLENGEITTTAAGAFTVEAVVSYAGYNIKRNAELHVTVNEPAPPTRTLSGRLSFDAALTDGTDFTGATVKVGIYDATVMADGSWTAEVPHGTYTVTATHPAYAAKSVENFAVNADAPAPELKFTMFAARGNGNNTNVYDWENKAYNQSFGTSASGNARVSFPGFTAGANEEFVFRATLLYSENTGNNGNWKYGLALHDGSENLADSAFSLGLFLANDGGRFYACKKLDQGVESLGRQGDFFGGTKGTNVPVLPEDLGKKTITLTYVRKSADGELKWYMIAEWDSTGDGVNDKRFVREPDDALKAELAAIDNAEIYFDLTFGVDASNGASKCGNLYFAKGSEAVGAIDLEEGLTSSASVIAAIEALPGESELTLNDAGAVEAARFAYEALTSFTKTQVSNYSKLEAAEAIIVKLKEISSLTPTFVSGVSIATDETYTPQITGYEFGEVQTSVVYSVKGTDNTAGAALENGTVTVQSAGEFTVVAVISYAGYNIKLNVEQTVVAIDPEAPTRELSGRLSFDSAITNAVDYTGASVKIGVYSATVSADGSWTVAEISYGTYTVTATHPWFVTKTVESFTVGENTVAPEIVFDTFSAHGNAGATATTFEYGTAANTYHAGANGTAKTGNTRIDFDATTVEANKEFVFKVDILQSTNETTNWKYGLTIHDGSADFKDSAFSYGILLANDSNGRFMGFVGLDTTNTSQGSQPITNPSSTNFGSGNAPTLPASNGERISLTFLRKKVDGVLTWYMIAEWDFNEQGVAGKRFVRQPVNNTNNRNFLDALQALDGKEIHLGLTLCSTDPVTGTTTWGNVYFATGEGVAANVDLKSDTGESAKVQAVIDEINALPAESELTLNDAGAVETARNSYNALAEIYRSDVTNYEKLTAAEAVMAVLQQIDALEPAFTSGSLMTTDDSYTPEIKNYRVDGVTELVVYSVKETGNTAGAALENGTVTVQSAGEFTVVATITYTGYNATQSAELTVTAVNPEAPTRTLSGRLSFDTALTDGTDFTGATVRIGGYDAAVSADGSWTAEVPYDTYTVTATHPWFVTKTVESFTVGENTVAPEIVFDTFSAHGNAGATATTFEYGTAANTYQAGANDTAKTGNTRIDFDATTVEANKEFVFKVDILQSTNEMTNWKYGLTIHDGSADFKDSAFSYGILLANDSNGRFMGFVGLDTTNTSQGSQPITNPSSTNFGSGNAPTLPASNGERISLTFLRKKVDGVLTWYMIAEWDFNEQGVAGKRFVRQPVNNTNNRNFLDALQALDSKEIHLGLTLCSTDKVTGTTTWGNVYFATGEGVADGIDLTTTTN